MEWKSCIVGQFRLLADLDPEEIELLESLERDVQTFEAGSILCEMGSETDCFFTVHDGWACAVRILADGQRQVLDIFLPGQIMGLREIGFNRSQSELVCLTDVQACPFPRKRLRDVFDRAPRVADLFFLVLSREQAMLTERIINIGRRPAAERLGHFLLEMKARLQLDENRFHLPLNQAIIGDALGLSSVHVSRTLAQLRERKLVEVDNREVSINDLEALVEFSGFDRDYLDCSSSWARQA